MKTKWWMFGLDAPLETPPPAVEGRPPSNLHRKNDVGDIVSELIFVKNQEEWLARNAKLAVIEEELRVAEAKRAKNGGVDVKVSLPESLMGPLGSILGRSRRWLEKKKKSLQQEMVDCAKARTEGAAPSPGPRLTASHHPLPLLQVDCAKAETKEGETKCRALIVVFETVAARDKVRGLGHAPHPLSPLLPA